MREIIFRGKRVDNGKWAYGDLIHTRGGWPLICTKHDFGGDIETCEVRTDTVEQYTGLTDKNGNKIFEGDIVGHPLSGTKGIVRYMDFGFVVHEPKHDNLGDCYYQPYNSTKKATVIGNIHDNPELMEQ